MLPALLAWRSRISWGERGGGGGGVEEEEEEEEEKEEEEEDMFLKLKFVNQYQFIFIYL